MKRGRPSMKPLALIKDEVPLGSMELAKRRIQPHLLHLQLVGYDLAMVMAHCYLQGVRDMAETLIQKQMVTISEMETITYLDAGEGI